MRCFVFRFLFAAAWFVSRTLGEANRQARARGYVVQQKSFIVLFIMPIKLNFVSLNFVSLTATATHPVPKTRVAAHKIHIFQDRLLKFGMHYC